MDTAVKSLDVAIVGMWERQEGEEGGKEEVRVEGVSKEAGREGGGRQTRDKVGREDGAPLNTNTERGEAEGGRPGNAE